MKRMCSGSVFGSHERIHEGFRGQGEVYEGKCLGIEGWFVHTKAVFFIGGFA
jgi:hypothetical protein